MVNLSIVGTRQASTQTPTGFSSENSDRVEVDSEDLASNANAAAVEYALSPRYSLHSTYQGSSSSGSWEDSSGTWSAYSRSTTMKPVVGSPESRGSVGSDSFLPFDSPVSDYGTGSPEPSAHPTKQFKPLPKVPEFPSTQENK
jgi:hypothetical protein